MRQSSKFVIKILYVSTDEWRILDKLRLWLRPRWGVQWVVLPELSNQRLLNRVTVVLSGTCLNLDFGSECCWKQQGLCGRNSFACSDVNCAHDLLWGGDSCGRRWRKMKNEGGERRVWHWAGLVWIHSATYDVVWIWASELVWASPGHWCGGDEAWFLLRFSCG